MRKISLLLFAAALLALASQAWAYTIYFKGGGRMIAKEKYRIEGDRAIIIQESGVTTSVLLSEIDIARTEEANRKELGRAVDLTDPKRDQPYQENRPASKAGGLTDLIERRGATQERLATPPPTSARSPEVSPSLAASQERRQPFSRANVSAEIFKLLGSLDVVGIYQGRSGGRPLVEVRVAGERDTLLALQTAAEAVVTLQRAFPAEVPALELFMRTSGGERAGQFTLTSDLVAELVGKKQTAGSFFLENVEF